MRHDILHLKDFYDFLGADGADPVLEIYLPYNMPEMGRENQKRPCMVICPGGAYRFCSEREAEAVALHFLPEGYNVFVLNYSTAPHRYPTQVREVAAAMELIHNHADQWNCDPKNIALMGFSAGGHLAASYCAKYNSAEVREVFPESKPVQASVLCYPVITADMKFTHRESMLNLIGHEPSEEETAYHSCENHVSGQTPPTFLWHTASDPTVPVINSLFYAKALTEHHVPVELHIYPFGGHGLSTCDEHTCDDVSTDTAYAHQWIASLKKWLKNYGRRL